MFLPQLYRYWKKMFYALLVLVLLQVFFMYKAVETVPFFLYNMYSTPQRNGDTAHRLTIYLNGRRLDAARLSGHEQETLLGSMAYYRKLKAQRYFATDSATVSRRLGGWLPASLYGTAFRRLTNTELSDSLFLAWWARYLSQVAGEPTDSFSLVESTVLWKPAYREVQDTVSLINYHRAGAR